MPPSISVFVELSEINDSGLDSTQLLLEAAKR